MCFVSTTFETSPLPKRGLFCRKLTLPGGVGQGAMQVTAKVGELAAPTSPQPLMSLGDLSTLRVRAELDERDVGKIKLGDDVAVHADAFRGREFTGKIVNIAPIIRPGHIKSPESRNLTDFNRDGDSDRSGRSRPASGRNESRRIFPGRQ
jgi:HlyD family secretion protein